MIFCVLIAAFAGYAISRFDKDIQRIYRTSACAPDAAYDADTDTHVHDIQRTGTE